MKEETKTACIFTFIVVVIVALIHYGLRYIETGGLP